MNAIVSDIAHLLPADWAAAHDTAVPGMTSLSSGIVDVPRMRKLHIDYETRGVPDLNQCGVYPYAEHPHTSALVLAWAVDDEPFACWNIRGGHPMPDRLRAALLNPDVQICAHNANFEWVISMVVGRRQGFLDDECLTAMMPLARWSCTAARAAACGLPRALEKVAQALHLEHQKDMAGHKLMLEMCKPYAFDLDMNPLWLEDAGRMERLSQYAVSDGYAEREVDDYLPDLSEFEHEVWACTERMNSRGVEVDKVLLQKLSVAVGDAVTSLNNKINRLTNGQVEKVTQPKKIVAWLKNYDIDTEDDKIGKWIIAGLLEDPDIPAIVREVLVIRRDGGKSSTSKFNTLMKRLNLDGRIRGALLYAGAAATARWSSRGVQLQNLPRGKIVKDVLAAIDAILTGMPLAEIETKFGPPMVVFSELVRPILIAAPKHWLARGDYSQIEARVLPWLSGEESKTRAFMAYDRGEGPDIYIVTAASMNRVPTSDIDKDDPRRQSGKVTDLACIAEDQMVRTDCGLVPIQRVTLEMKVWDGIEWVNHGGVIYKGERECIEHDGLIATEDHEVFVANASGTVSFGIAAAGGFPLHRAGLERPESGHGSGHERYYNSHPKGEERVRSCGVGGLLGVRSTPDMAALGPPADGHQFRLPILRGERNRYLSLASKKDADGQRSVHQTGQTASGMGEIRGPGDNLRLPEREIRGGVVSSKLGYAVDPDARSAYRPNRKQPRLRAGELEVFDAGRERYQSRHNPMDSVRGRPGSNGACDPCVPVPQPDNILLGCDAGAPSPLNRRDRNIAPVRNGGPDKTRRHVWDILNAGPRHRFTVSGRLVHNCGFGGGKGALHAMAKIYGMKLTDDQAQTFVDLWREANPNTKQFWYDLENTAVKCMQSAPGPIFRAGKTGLISFKRNNQCLAMILPSGRRIIYWYARLEEVDTPWGTRKWAVTYYGEDSQKHIWRRFTAWYGIFCENCLTGDTEVMSSSGWKRLDSINSEDLVWDGVEWVNHSGIISRGEQKVINFAGVRLTGDHKVLTDRGMVAAENTTPAEAVRAFAKHYALPTIDVGSGRFSGVHRSQTGDMAVPVRLRSIQRPSVPGYFTRLGALLRVRHIADESRRYEIPHDVARNVEAPGVRGVESYGSALPQSESQSLSRLRRAWNQGVQRVAHIRRVLEGHGANLRVGIMVGKKQQRFRIFATELPVGHSTGTGSEHPICDTSGHPLGSHDCGGSRGPGWVKTDHVVFPDQSRMAGGSNVQRSGCHQESYAEEVFDILNAGPRHRFTVRGPDGKPFIVSNCVQAIARDIMAYSLVLLERRGMCPVLTVHDEAVCQLRKRDFPTAWLAGKSVLDIMLERPSWAPGLPIAAEASADVRYTKGSKENTVSGYTKDLF